MFRQLGSRLIPIVAVLVVMTIAATPAWAQRQRGRGRNRRSSETVQLVKTNELPAAVAETVQKDAPNVNFTRIEKHSSKQNVYYVLQGTDAAKQRVTLRISSSGKLLNSKDPSKSGQVSRGYKR